MHKNKGGREYMISRIKGKNTTIFILCLLIFLILAQNVVLADTSQNININTQRLDGVNRFETAAAVSKEGWTISDAVVLVNARNFPDALAGVPFAYSKDAPILLTEKDSIPKATKDEMVRLKAKNVYILGGEGSVAEGVVNALSDENYRVDIIWGINRFDTAIQIGEEMMRENRSDTAILTSAYNFPDALAISSYAAMKHYPILFTDPSSLTDKTKAFIMRWNIKKIIIPGGTGAVSGAVSSELWNSGVDYKQIDGFNRYTTALNISKQYKDDYGKDVMLATGKDFPDALAGGVLAAKKICLYCFQIRTAWWKKLKVI
jgi:N-acetylmuramoyl-L-alanine amidase